MFYDAVKAPAEIISKQTIFNGLKRAHDYSNIGEISNMLTCLWNRNNPDIHAAAQLVYVNNLRIDGAKCGATNEYTNYPDVTKRINKATGGSHARLPAFFFYTKNGRAADKPKEKYAKQNNSTMNRICAAFDGIGNINMNFAGIPPFNYQMFMSEPFYEKNADVVQTFCDMDGMSISAEIAFAEISPNERSNVDIYAIVAEDIKATLIEKFGSLEYCYPFLVKALFAGDNWKKSSHKKMFWRIFGEIAISNLERNLKNYTVCLNCDAKIPKWADEHTCPKDNQGFFVCEDCGKQCIRIGSRQYRCEECQRTHRDEAKRISDEKTKVKKRELRREYEKEFYTTLQSYWMPMSKTGRSGLPSSFVSLGQQTKNDQDGE